MRRWGLILLILLVTLGVHAASQSSAQTIMDTPLNNAPYSDAGTIVTLPPAPASPSFRAKVAGITCVWIQARTAGCA